MDRSRSTLVHSRDRLPTLWLLYYGHFFATDFGTWREDECTYVSSCTATLKFTYTVLMYGGGDRTLENKFQILIKVEGPLVAMLDMLMVVLLLVTPRNHTVSGRK